MISSLKRLLIIFIFAIPAIGFLVTPNDYLIKGENRLIQKFPELGAGDFFASLQKYFNDRLFLKNTLTDKYAPTVNELLQAYPFDNTCITVKGLDGWLFAGNGLPVPVYSHHIKDVPLSADYANSKIANLKMIRSALNVPFYIVIGPDKHTVYSDKMNPYFGYPGKFRFFNKVEEYFKANGLEVIDPSGALIEAKKTSGQNALYFMDDTHWNLLGGYHAFNYIMKDIIPDFRPEKYEFNCTKHPSGDLVLNRLHPKTNMMDECFVNTNKVSTISVYPIDKESDIKHKDNAFDYAEYIGHSVYINSSPKDSRKLLILTDSFGSASVPYFANYFKETVHMQRANGLDTIVERIQKINPDLIIYINVERDLSY